MTKIKIEILIESRKDIPKEYLRVDIRNILLQKGYDVEIVGMI